MTSTTPSTAQQSIATSATNRVRDALRAALDSGQVTQRGLARQAKQRGLPVHQSMLSELLRGCHAPGIDALAAVADLIGLDLSDLFGGGALQRVALDRLTASPFNPRKSFDPDRLRQLADSLATDGLLQNLVARPGDGDQLVIVAGERRFRALCQLDADGRLTDALPDGLVPVKIVEADDAAHQALAILENDQRDALNPIEEADAYQRLIEGAGWTVGDLAKRLQTTRRHVEQRLQLLSLPDAVKAALLAGQIDFAKARALAPHHDDADLQLRALDRIKQADPAVATRDKLVTWLRGQVGDRQARIEAAAQTDVEPGRLPIGDALTYHCQDQAHRLFPSSSLVTDARLGQPRDKTMAPGPRPTAVGPTADGEPGSQLTRAQRDLVLSAWRLGADGMDGYASRDAVLATIRPQDPRLHAKANGCGVVSSLACWTWSLRRKDAGAQVLVASFLADDGTEQHSLSISYAFDGCGGASSLPRAADRDGAQLYPSLVRAKQAGFLQLAMRVLPLVTTGRTQAIQTAARGLVKQAWGKLTDGAWTTVDRARTQAGLTTALTPAPVDPHADHAKRVEAARDFVVKAACQLADGVADAEAQLQAAVEQYRWTLAEAPADADADADADDSDDDAAAQGAAA